MPDFERPYQTERLAKRVTDLTVVPIDEKELEALKFSFPNEIRELESYQAEQILICNNPWAVKLHWRGKIRVPLELEINGREIYGGQNGELIGADGQKIGAKYIRLVDDYQSENPEQKMLVFGATPTANQG